MRKYLPSIIITTLLLCPSVAQAEKIILTDGTVIYGTTKETGNLLIIQTANGRLTIPLSQIDEITNEKPPKKKRKKKSKKKRAAKKNKVVVKKTEAETPTEKEPVEKAPAQKKTTIPPIDEQVPPDDWVKASKVKPNPKPRFRREIGKKTLPAPKVAPAAKGMFEPIPRDPSIVKIFDDLTLDGSANSSRNRAKALNKLIALKEKAVPTLCDIVRSESDRGKIRGAAYALGRIGDKRAIEILINRMVKIYPSEEIPLKAERQTGAQFYYALTRLCGYTPPYTFDKDTAIGGRIARDYAVWWETNKKNFPEQIGVPRIVDPNKNQ